MTYWEVVGYTLFGLGAVAYISVLGIAGVFLLVYGTAKVHRWSRWWGAIPYVLIVTLALVLAFAGLVVMLD